MRRPALLTSLARLRSGLIQHIQAIREGRQQRVPAGPGISGDAQLQLALALAAQLFLQRQVLLAGAAARRRQQQVLLAGLRVELVKLAHQAAFRAVQVAD